MRSDRIKSFLKDETGANAVEYALLAGLLSIAVAIGITLVGDGVKSSYQAICSAVVTYTKFGNC